jgi:hypothetical protein
MVINGEQVLVSKGELLDIAEKNPASSGSATPSQAARSIKSTTQLNPRRFLLLLPSMKEHQKKAIRSCRGHELA